MAPASKAPAVLTSTCGPLSKDSSSQQEGLLTRTCVEIVWTLDRHATIDSYPPPRFAPAFSGGRMHIFRLTSPTQIPYLYKMLPLMSPAMSLEGRQYDFLANRVDSDLTIGCSGRSRNDSRS